MLREPCEPCILCFHRTDRTAGPRGGPAVVCTVLTLSPSPSRVSHLSLKSSFHVYLFPFISRPSVFGVVFCQARIFVDAIFMSCAGLNPMSGEDHVSGDHHLSGGLSGTPVLQVSMSFWIIVIYFLLYSIFDIQCGNPGLEL